MKRLIIFVMVTSLLVGACSSFSGKKTDLSNAKPGDKVNLSETLQFDTVPEEVIPYATKPALEFSDLQLTPDGDIVDGKVNYSRDGKDEFVLVLVLSLKDEILFGYFDPDTNLSLHLPSGTVLFGIKGYNISGTNQGTIQFSLTGHIFDGYSVFDPNVTAFLFAVPGKVHANSVMPGNQTDPKTFQANSNVLRIKSNLQEV